jgi:8-oxo-dGTP pyrophosphatase MutT (NUDIX family)
MILKIYFAAHPVFLCSQLDEIIEENPEYTDSIFLKDLSEKSLAICQQLLEKPGNYPCYYLYHDLPKLLDALLGSAITIDAGGGVVYNENDEVLLILRRGKWDLPKGKLDPGESIIDCALREVIEETGLKNLTLLDKLTSSMYCYREKGQLVLKQVQWYKMRTADRHQLTPQAEEDITEIKWINLQELDPYLQNTYDTIKEVLLLAQRSPNSIG